MKKGQIVSWLVAGKVVRGCGTVLTDEEDGKVLVAVDHMFGEANPGFHPVICCTVTWLKSEDASVPPLNNDQSVGNEAYKIV